MTPFQEIVREKVPLLEMKPRIFCTLDDSHRTGTTEIVQAIKSVEENIEDSKEQWVSMLLNDVEPLLTAVQFQLSLYDGCHPVY